jgi:ligand-binding sensor domain-containing protein
MDKKPSQNNNPRPENLFISIVIIVVIELIFLPGNLLIAQDTVDDGKRDTCSNGKGISVMNVNSVVVDDDNVKWFSTDLGIVSFDGENWKLYSGIMNLPDQDLKGISYAGNPEGAELWIASPSGATVTRLPIDDQTDAITYSPENAEITGKEVLGIAAGNDSIRWIGTDKGISALMGEKWLEPYYDLHYPDRMFKVFPITSMATNLQGDSLYVGTAGAGVLRVYRDNLDGISGASVYAEWGPIILPSDNIQSIFIAPDGTKWFGTKKGIARHTGNNTLDNWTVFTTNDGLVHNFVQAITGDNQGNIWFGTKEGISVYNGSSWISYTTDNGLASGNILSIAIDHDGIVWIGTDAGISSYRAEKFTNY